jgi:predicted metallo-beta-lactamase superfamily hydrolase
MMTRIESENTVFVHASDIQLLDGKAISLILDWQPDIVLASGPPLHLARLLPKHREVARRNARRLACRVDTLILDHHLLRCEEGLSWLGHLSSETARRVICAADFMERPRCLLEAQREQLYEDMPVPEGWHEAYARGDSDTLRYRNDADVVHPGVKRASLVPGAVGVETWRVD